MLRGVIFVLIWLAIATAAFAQSCDIPTDDMVAAKTAKCLLNVDGKLVIDQRCNYSVSPDGHEYLMDAGKYYAAVRIRPSDGAAIAYWNRGSGRSDGLTPLGPVKSLLRGSLDCSQNRRFEMCASEYQGCKCRPNEDYSCIPPN